MLARTFGCVRVVYNYALRLRTDAFYQRGERLGYLDSSAALTQLKKQQEYVWLKEVSCVPLQQTLRHLEKALQNFFAQRADYPTYKRKHDRQGAEYTRSGFRWDGQNLFLAKMDEPLRSAGPDDLPGFAFHGQRPDGYRRAVLRQPARGGGYSPSCG